MAFGRFMAAFSFASMTATDEKDTRIVRGDSIFGDGKIVVT